MVDLIRYRYNRETLDPNNANQLADRFEIELASLTVDELSDMLQLLDRLQSARRATADPGSSHPPSIVSRRTAASINQNFKRLADAKERAAFLRRHHIDVLGDITEFKSTTAGE